MRISIAELARAAQCTDDLAQTWATPLSDAMQARSIDTPCRAAAFLGQVLHESAGLTRLTENLNYSAARLVQVWPAHFCLPPTVSPSRQDATQYAHRPEPLANLIYADRMGNGPALSGDGWRFRGRGLMQITGRTAYTRAAQGLGLDLVEDPDLLLLPMHAAQSAAWYWSTVDGNAYADEDSASAFENLTVAINGGVMGLQQRSELWKRAKTVLADLA